MRKRIERGRCETTPVCSSKGTRGDNDIAKAAGIFDTLGYHEYDDSDDLKNRLTAHIETAHLPFSPILDRQAPVYLVEPSTRSEDIQVTISRIKKAGYRFRSFNPEEDSRLSATDAIRQVASSSGILVPLQEVSAAGSDVHNIRCMFVAGLADGMSKPKLILSPATYDTPLDVRDDVKIFKRASDIFDLSRIFAHSLMSTQVEPSLPVLTAHLSFNLSALAILAPRTR